MMAFPDDQVAWLLSNRPTVLRYIHGLQVIVGLVVMALGFHMGHVHFHLIRAGVRTQGRIIGYHQEQFPGSSQTFRSTGYMPVVEYRMGGDSIQFQDWLGKPVAFSGDDRSSNLELAALVAHPGSRRPIVPFRKCGPAPRRKLKSRVASVASAIESRAAEGGSLRARRRRFPANRLACDRRQSSGDRHAQKLKYAVKLADNKPRAFVETHSATGGCEWTGRNKSCFCAMRERKLKRCYEKPDDVNNATFALVKRDAHDFCPEFQRGTGSTSRSGTSEDIAAGRRFGSRG